MPPTATMYGHSPHSSSGLAGSSEGTPDTRFTAFSPEDARPVKTASLTITPLTTTQADPFVTSSAKVKAEQKLSATASDFKPFAQNVSNVQTFDFASSATAALPGMVQNLKNLIGQMPGYGSQTSVAPPVPVKAAPQGTTNQVGAFSTDTSVTRLLQVKTIYKSDVSLPQIVVNSLEDFKKNGGFKRIGSERIEIGNAAVYIRYSNINDATEVYTALKLDLPHYAVEYISPAAFASAVNSPSKGSYSSHEGQVVLIASYPIGTPYNKKAFEEGLIALLSAEGNLFAWQKQAATEAGTFRMVVEYCDAAHAVRTVQRLHGRQIKFPQGDFVLQLDLHTPDIQQPSQRLGNLTTPTRRPSEPDLAETLGRLSLNSGSSFLRQHEAFASAVPSPSVLSYLPPAPSAAAFGLPPNPLPLVMGGLYGAAIAFPPGYPSGMHIQGQIGGGDLNTYPPVAFGHNNFAVAHNGYDYGYNQLGFQSQSYDQAFDRSNALTHHHGGSFPNHPSARRQNALKVAHHGHRRGNGLYRDEHDQATGQHNQVDIHRIKQGIDVRTTVMLRNIPNKVDQATLKTIVDESSFGRYDFMYLRIDFSNDCNVGYAFINFVDPLDIIDFVIARSNQKWHMFKSDKVAEVSYATIQGRDCLIQKFRNSSVMLEPPHYRPKLFFTIHDRAIGRVGEEEDFPPSDNSSKLRRSCENAEHVGLFAPNAGQQLRDDQRRRRSQFDRGTSLAEREENFYDDSSMHVHRSIHSATYRGYLQRMLSLEA